MERRPPLPRVASERLPWRTLKCTQSARRGPLAGKNAGQEVALTSLPNWLRERGSRCREVTRDAIGEFVMSPTDEVTAEMAEWQGHTGSARSRRRFGRLVRQALTVRHWGERAPGALLGILDRHGDGLVDP